MAQAEVYMAPHPDKSVNAYVERAGLQEYDGVASAGRLISADDTGRMAHSLLPFAESADIGQPGDEVDTSLFPVRVDSTSGTVWRWFGLQGLVSRLREALLDIAVPVGSVRFSMGGAPGERWLVLDGREIGARNSGSALAGDDYKRLFIYLWDNAGDAISLRTFAGAETVRGVDAESDWNLDKRMKLPDPSGRTFLMAGVGEGLSQRIVGAVGGAEEVTLTTATMPRHAHTVNAAQSGVAERVEFLSAVAVAVSVTSTATTVIDGASTATVRAAQVEDHSHANTLNVQNADASHTHLLNIQSEEQQHRHNLPQEAGGGETADTAIQFIATNISTESAAANHGHNLGGAVGSVTRTATGHTHTLDFEAGFTARTTVSSPAGVEVTPTRRSVQVYGVSSGNTTTSETGSGAAHENMPPYFVVAALIRY